MCIVQRRSIVTVLDGHRRDLDVSLLFFDLKELGILTSEQIERLTSLDDKERKHEALLYILLANDGPDTYHKLVEYLGNRNISIAANLQGMLVCQIVCFLFTIVFGMHDFYIYSMQPLTII